MQAIILAGGFGTRLRSVLADVPKPMAPIHDKPFLAYLLDYLKAQGITELFFPCIICVNKFEAYFQRFLSQVYIRYAVEEQPLGTGGAIVKSLQLIDPSSLCLF